MHEYVLWETQEKYGSELNPSEEKEKSLLGNIISCPWDRCLCVSLSFQHVLSSVELLLSLCFLFRPLSLFTSRDPPACHWYAVTK